MCGIVGIARFKPAEQAALVSSMNAAQRHRGPDDEGAFQDVAQGVALGMTRLSILDIAGGHQPMFDETHRHALVFNGEIYNYRDLWDELVALGHRFASDHSDTEVLVHGFEEWGTGLFPRLNGMFAVAIWDSATETLTLARDRAGEKPLYVGNLQNGGWVFASEMKSLLLHPDLERTIDVLGLEEYLAFDFVIGPRTMLRDVWKVPAGSWAAFTANGHQVQPFWSPNQDPVTRTDAELFSELDRALARSVELRMVADVPVGLFLSGGLDSTTIGWYMARASDRVRAFAIGFEDPAFDESAEAKLAAAHLGVQLDLHTFSADDVLELVPRITELLDEPMGDQSVFPTHLLSEVAREKVTVALGGDGSDELFMGYRTYQALKVGWSIDAVPGVRDVARLAGRHLPERRGTVGRAARFGQTLDLRPEQRLLARLGSFHGDSRWVLADELRQRIDVSAMERASETLMQGIGEEQGAAQRSIHAYFRGYLQEDILVKVDRASMATSLEVRSPFLDPDVIDLALSIPPDRKLRGLTRKDPLRRLMRGRIPDRTIDRPKRGFGVPLNAWMRGPLAGLVRDHLSVDLISAAGIFDPVQVEGIVQRHEAGDDTASQQTWLLLQFEMWRRRWLGSSTDVGIE